MRRRLGIAKQHYGLLMEAALLAAFGAGACAADPGTFTGKKKTDLDEQIADASTRIGARVSFHHSDFYSITAPHPQTQCAGDAKTFYDQFTVATLESGYTGPTGADISTWKKLDEDVSNSNETTKPAFIKNVSVDLTDSNAAVTSNQAFGCSYGNSEYAPPVSSCSTFDYGAIGGIPTTMGGTLLLIGGIQSRNYSGFSTVGSDSFKGASLSCGPSKDPSTLSAPTGYTQCNSDFFALGIQSLPSTAAGSSLAPGLTTASGKISSWANISAASSYSGPEGAAGASAAYNETLQQLLVFGGAAPLSGLGAYGAGAASYDSWIYDLQSQKWTKSTNALNVDQKMLSLYDYNVTDEVVYQFQHSNPAAALFGYTTAQGMALSGLTAAGTVAFTDVDRTDRIAIVGGLTSLSETDDVSRLFNPTYAPEYRDSLKSYTIVAVDAAASGLVQWLSNYHTQSIDNSYEAVTAASRLTTHYAGGMLSQPFNMGLVSLRRNAGPGAGYLLKASGFDLASPDGSRNINEDPTCGTVPTYPAGFNYLNVCGSMQLKTRYNEDPADPVDAAAADSVSANFSIVPNYYTSSASASAVNRAPALWTPVKPEAVGSFVVPFLGGVTMLPGFDVTENHVLNWGGTDCFDYLQAKTTATACYFGNTASSSAGENLNPGKFWKFGADPTAKVAAAGVPSDVKLTDATGASVPNLAGMAAARGLDGSGNMLIVAFGGIKSPGGELPPNNVLYYIPQYDLSNGALADAQKYVFKTAAPTNYLSGPAAYANAAMVFSHVTRKFYLFGGYQPASLTSNNDTWELSVSGSCMAASPACTFTWRKLTPTCHPATCPTARRSHRMVEVDYYARNPGGSQGATYFTDATFYKTGENNCTDPKKPCSYGIFMEGGTSTGMTFLNDRWMFDPTGNGGQGHWQQMGELPPRTLAAMSNVSYTLPTSGNSVHRAILFGGETGMQNPALAASGNYFVPPTLGDTWMFDYKTTSWHRVTLLGKGYKDTVLGTLTEFEKRQGFATGTMASVSDFPGNFSDDDGNRATFRVLTPPPLAGAVMITRTHSKTSHLSTDNATPLKIPEVFLFGGRTKDGAYHKISNVYKFCTGTTGEKLSLANPNGAAATMPTRSDATTATDDATCDAYDSYENPSSPSPTSQYVGRWLQKKPEVTTTVLPHRVGAYLAAGAYDPVHDRVLFTGGLRSTSGSVTDNYQQGITDLTNRATNTMGVFEYTPPYHVNPTDDPTSRAETQGKWDFIPSCSGYPTPTGRYGHSMAYDSLNRQVIVTGGYDANGEPLTYTHTFDDGSTSTFPEVWTGYRVDSAGDKTSDGTEITIGTIPCYYWKQISVFGNLNDGSTPSAALAHAAGVFVPSSGYNTGYYSVFDNACPKSGPISTPNSEVSKLRAGGVYFDIDRGQLGATENLLLNITYIPFGTDNQRPDTARYSKSEEAYFKVHLVKTSQPADSIKQVIQPRHLTYSATDQYPEVVQTLAILAPPAGDVRQEQIIIPLAANPSVDRIRLERYSGSGIIVDASLFRMGQK